MARIQSPVEILNGLHLRAFPTRPIEMRRVVRVGNTNFVLAEDQQGRLYVNGSSMLASDCHVYIEQGCFFDRSVGNLFQALVKLGRITDEQRIAAVEKFEELDRANEAGHTLKRVRMDLAEFGIKLTKAQEKKLRRIAGEEDDDS